MQARRLHTTEKPRVPKLETSSYLLALFIAFLVQGHLWTALIVDNQGYYRYAATLVAANSRIQNRGTVQKVSEKTDIFRPYFPFFVVLMSARMFSGLFACVGNIT